MAKPVNVLGTASVAAVATSVDDCTTLDCRTCDSLAVVVPAASGVTSLTPHAALSPDGLFAPLHRDGSAITITVAASKAHIITSAGEWPGYVKLVANTSGTVHVVGARSTNK